MKKYFSLIKFREVKVEDAKLLLNWRTKRRISKFMLTDISKSLNKQKNCVMASYKKKNYYHWIILFKKKPIGFLSINNINLKKKNNMLVLVLRKHKVSYDCSNDSSFFL